MYQQEKRFKFNSLQIARGVAAIMVMWHHCMEYENKFSGQNIFHRIYSNGSAGVWFFFILSGFIIYYSSENYIDQPNSLFEYLKKRIIRIYPIYWVIVSAVLMLGYINPILLHHEYSYSLYHLIKTYSLYFIHPSPIAVSWTLSYELLFYALFALLIISSKFKYVLIGILLVSINNLFGFFPSLQLKTPLLAFITSHCNIYFTLGIFSFIISKYNLIQYNSIALLACIIYFLLAHHVFEYFFPGLNIAILALFSFGLGAFAIVCLLIAFDKKNTIIFPDFVLLIGNSSYVIYLIHYPLIYLSSLIYERLQISLYPPFYFIIVMITIVILSCIIHISIEKPLLGAFTKLFRKKEIIFSRVK